MNFSQRSNFDFGLGLGAGAFMSGDDGKSGCGVNEIINAGGGRRGIAGAGRMINAFIEYLDLS